MTYITLDINLNLWYINIRLRGIVMDINRKKELMDMITKIKRGSEEYGKYD